MGVACGISSSWAVIFCCSEHGRPLESLSSTVSPSHWIATAPPEITRHTIKSVNVKLIRVWFNVVLMIPRPPCRTGSAIKSLMSSLNAF